MARKHLPTQLKVVKGTLKKSRVNHREPVVTGDLREPPEYFSQEQRDVWHYAIEHAPIGLLKRLDISMLENWVCAVVVFRQAQQKVQEQGLTIISPNGMEIQNPHLGIMNRQSQIMMKAASEMGFSPASRSKIVIVEEKIKDDPWSKLVNES